MDVQIPFNKTINLSARVYDISDKKNLIIIAHGFTLSNETPPFPELETLFKRMGYSTLNLDLYGHGESDGDFSNITIQKGMDSISAAINYAVKNGFQNISLFGESFGGQCSILIAPKYDLEFLILKSPVSNYPEVEAKRRTPEVLKNWKEEGFITFTNGLGNEMTLGYDFYEGLHNHDSPAAASEINCPTLILHGDADPTVPYEQSEKLQMIIRDSTLIKYPGANHKIHQSDSSEKMFTDIRKFVEEQN